MGTYVYYYLGDETGIRSRFLSDLDQFTAWYAPLVAEYPDDYPQAHLGKLLDLKQRGIEAFKIESDDDAHVIDRLLDEYWGFCDSKALHRKLEITRSAHKWYRYAPDLADVLPSASELAKSYYRRIFAGRSAAECVGHTYLSEDGFFHLSWLLPAEVSEFLSELARLERYLNLTEDNGTAVSLVLAALKEANSNGASLIVVIA